MSHTARSLFVRPSNIVTSHLLQTLAIVGEISARSQGTLTYFRFQREPDQARLLNFGSLTFQSREAAREIEEQAHRIHVPLNSRAATDKATLSALKTGVNRDVGLKEVARLIGIDLHVQEDVEDTITAPSMVQSRAKQQVMLSDVDEDVEEGVYDVTLKLEKRQKGEFFCANMTAWSHAYSIAISTEATSSHRRPLQSKDRRHRPTAVQQALHEFGGFSKP